MAGFIATSYYTTAEKAQMDALIAEQTKRNAEAASYEDLTNRWNNALNSWNNGTTMYFADGGQWWFDGQGKQNVIYERDLAQQKWDIALQNLKKANDAIDAKTQALYDKYYKVYVQEQAFLNQQSTNQASIAQAQSAGVLSQASVANTAQWTKFLQDNAIVIVALIAIIIYIIVRRK